MNLHDKMFIHCLYVLLNEAYSFPTLEHKKYSLQRKKRRFPFVFRITAQNRKVIILKLTYL